MRFMSRTGTRGRRDCGQLILHLEGLEDPTYYYGWVHLQDRTILESALSEMPLIVGTGQVIPEPSSAVLLLLGFAGLALRRGKRKEEEVA